MGRRFPFHSTHLTACECHLYKNETKAPPIGPRLEQVASCAMRTLSVCPSLWQKVQRYPAPQGDGQASHTDSLFPDPPPRCRPLGTPKPQVPSPRPDPSALPATLHHPQTALSLPRLSLRQTPLLCLDPGSVGPACSVFQMPCLPEIRRGLLPITHRLEGVCHS